MYIISLNVILYIKRYGFAGVNMNWYALFVSTGREEYVEKWIHYEFSESECTCFTPKRKLIEKKQNQKYQIIRPLFPGYIFINTSMDDNLYYRFINIPKVFRVLRNGEYYARVTEDEINFLHKITGSSNVVDLSQVFIINSKVVVKSGPLTGLEGIVQRIDKHNQRARIVINFLGSQKVVDLGIEIISMDR